MSNPTPKAKPTPFNGEMYESQLEARGAIFLDYHPLVTTYRPKPGTFLVDGEEYTPDFIIRIMGVDIIVEIKPTDPSQQHRDKLMKIAEYTRCEVIYLIGSWYKDGIPFIRSSNDKFEKPIALARHVLGTGRIGKIIEEVKAVRFDLNLVHKSKRIVSDEEFKEIIGQWQLFSQRLVLNGRKKSPRKT